MSKHALFALAFALVVRSALGQEIVLEGMVVDSISKQPVPFVSIAAKSRSSSTTSLENGRFRYACFFGDTVVFVRLGYQRKSVLATNSNVQIKLREIPRVLDGVTIYGSFQPQGADQWKFAIPNQLFQNPGGRPGNDYMQTLGIGASIGVQFDYFSKEKREKRKLVRVQEELGKTRVFREVVEAPETKRYLMGLFKMNEQQYLKKLADFNQQMTDAQRAKTKAEVLDLLVGFFALK